MRTNPSRIAAIAVAAGSAALLFAAALPTAARGAATAQRADVTIQVVPAPGGGGKKVIKVHDRATVVCRNPIADECPDDKVTWRVLNPLAENETVQIRYKSGDPACFAPGPFVISAATPPTGQVVESGPLKSDPGTGTCDPLPRVWLYSVHLCTKAEDGSESCDVTADPVDPGVIIDPGTTAMP